MMSGPSGEWLSSARSLRDGPPWGGVEENCRINQLPRRDEWMNCRLRCGAECHLHDVYSCIHCATYS